ncbi:MAG: TraB domain-containing protein [Candidatus Sigynarchaeota archaeon]
MLGVVHGQQSCIEEVRRVIEAERPLIVAIELPPNLPGTTVENLDDVMDRISSNYRNFFNLLKSLGLPSKYADKLEDLSIGLAMQGFEFLAAIEAAKKVNARVEFIDMRRERIFREFMAETMANLFQKPVEIFPGFTLPVMTLPGFSAITKVIASTLSEWQETFNTLTSIYGQKEYKALLKVIQPYLKKMDENPVFKDILVDQRNRYMAEKLVAMLKASSGKIVLVTGFGHVEGIKKIIAENLESDAG